MPTIKVTDIAWGRLRSPDLDRSEEFLTDFGMVRAARTSRALYMRGTDPQHHLHITELGDPKFIGFAFHAASEEDLAQVAKLPGASGIEHMDEPGGGRRVRLADPDGWQIEVVASDIDTVVLARAAQGIYDQEALEDLGVDAPLVVARHRP